MTEEKKPETITFRVATRKDVAKLLAFVVAYGAAFGLSFTGATSLGHWLF